MTDISIILAIKERPIALQHTLQSWSNIDCDSYELLVVDDGSENGCIKQMIDDFSILSSNLKYIRLEHDGYRLPNIAWNTGLDVSTGDFVLFAMGDIIISHKDIWQRIQDCYVGHRVNLMTYFMSPVTTEYLSVVEWENDPTKLEASPEFWDWSSEEGETNRYRSQHIEHHVARTNYVSGCERKRWKWFGGYRNVDDSELLGDNDLFYRERLLGIPATPIPVVRGYHQWHEKVFKSAGYSYRYKTELQARLLEEAERIEG